MKNMHELSIFFIFFEPRLSTTNWRKACGEESVPQICADSSTMGVIRQSYGLKPLMRFLRIIRMGMNS